MKDNEDRKTQEVKNEEDASLDDLYYRLTGRRRSPVGKCTIEGDSDYMDIGTDTESEGFASAVQDNGVRPTVAGTVAGRTQGKKKPRTAQVCIRLESGLAQRLRLVRLAVPGFDRRMAAALEKLVDCEVAAMASDIRRED